MTNKTEAVPLLTAEDAFAIRMFYIDPQNCGGREKLNAIADGRAIVISAADLAAKDAEIARLQNLVGEWERKAANWFASPAATQQLDGYRELAMRACGAEEENESLRRDAERYRWLRDPSIPVGNVIDKIVGESVSRGSIYEYRAGEELDAAIDAAMQGDKSK